MTAITVNLNPIIQLTDNQFYQLCRENPEVKFERNTKGEILIMSPTGGETGKRNVEVAADFVFWNRQTKLGVCFDSSTCFKLPNGANRSPDVAQRLTNSWIASISDSVIQIAKLNSKDHQKSYYIKSDQWGEYLAEAVEMAIRPASAEIFGGTLKPSQVSQRLQEKELIDFAENLLLLTYEYQPKELAKMIDNYLAELAGGKDWFE